DPVGRRVHRHRGEPGPVRRGARRGRRRHPGIPARGRPAPGALALHRPGGGTHGAAGGTALGEPGHRGAGHPVGRSPGRGAGLQLRVGGVGGGQHRAPPPTGGVAATPGHPRRGRVRDRRHRGRADAGLPRRGNHPPPGVGRGQAGRAGPIRLRRWPRDRAVRDAHRRGGGVVDPAAGQRGHLCRFSHRQLHLDAPSPRGPPAGGTPPSDRGGDPVLRRLAGDQCDPRRPAGGAVAAGRARGTGLRPAGRPGGDRGRRQTMTATDSSPAAASTQAGRNRGRHHLGIVAAGATLLGTAPLAVLYESWTWLAQAAVAVTLVASAAAVARTLRAPVPIQVVAMLAALLLAVTWQFRSGGELFLLPTGQTFAHFQTLLAEVPPLVATETIPLADHAGLLLLTMAGVGVVAIVVDVLTVSLRRPALVGLPLLAIYSIPVAVSQDRVSPVPFAVAVAGFLWLIATERLERVRRFGQRFTAQGRGVPVWEPSPLAAAGRRLAAVGILAAVLLPLAVPDLGNGLTHRLIGGGSGEGEGGGSGPATAVNLFAHLDGMLHHDETVELLRFTTDDPDPFYLRVGTADQVSNRGFHQRAPQGELVSLGVRSTAPIRAGATGHRHQARIEILAWDMNRLPVFAELTNMSGLDGDWRHDRDQQVVFAADERAAGLTYDIEYTRWEFDPEALRQARPLPGDHPMNRFTVVLPQLEVSELVTELTAEAATPYDEVLAILRHFSAENGFR